MLMLCACTSCTWAPPELADDAVGGRQVEELDQGRRPQGQLVLRNAREPAEVAKRLADGEADVQRQLLRDDDGL